jgi:uncharacterized coiled-coil protein SlyX
MTRIKWRTAAFAFALLGAVGASHFAARPAQAQTPSNAQLCKMLLEQKKIIDRQQRRIRALRRRLSNAEGGRKSAGRTIPRSRVRVSTRGRIRRIEARRRAVRTKKTGGWYAIGSVIGLKPSHKYLTYGIISQDASTPPTNRNSDTVTLEPSYSAGGQFGMGYGFHGTGIDVTGVVTFFRGSWSDSVSAPAGGSIVAVLSDPSVSGRDDAETASAEYRFHYLTFDVETGQKIRVGQHLSIRLHAGLRYAHFNEHFQVTYVGQNFPGGGQRVIHRNAFLGHRAALRGADEVVAAVPAGRLYRRRRGRRLAAWQFRL